MSVGPPPPFFPCKVGARRRPHSAWTASLEAYRSQERRQRIPTNRRAASPYTGTIVEHSIRLDAFDDDLKTFRQLAASFFAAKLMQQRRKGVLIVIVAQTQQLIQIVVSGAPEAVYLQLPCLSYAR